MVLSLGRMYLLGNSSNRRLTFLSGEALRCVHCKRVRDVSDSRPKVSNRVEGTQKYARVYFDAGGYAQTAPVIFY